MNERIRELAVECTFFTYGVNGELLYEGFNEEKFAELIVRECMTLCDDTQADYLKHRKATSDFDEKNIYAEGEAASDVIKYKMKKHFGVE